MKPGIELIAEERAEQIEKHGRTVEKDVELNVNGQLMDAVEELIVLPKNFYGFNTPTNWNKNLFTKMMIKPYKDRLVIAGALIAA